jgi:NACalpha-BTF3-like transcription factor
MTFQKYFLQINITHSFSDFSFLERNKLNYSEKKRLKESMGTLSDQTDNIKIVIEIRKMHQLQIQESEITVTSLQRSVEEFNSKFEMANEKYQQI